jgi:cytochrome d ubiquinol oxidase subunit I
VIDGVLPTFMGVSSLSATQVIMTMVGSRCSTARWR